MKIAIIGNAGSGKSTLGFALHKLLGLTLYHLDQYYWKPNWQESDYTEFKKIHDQLCDKKAWIIEGANTRILEYRIAKSDIIIFLDVPRYRCFYRVLKRALSYFGTVHFSSAEGCQERLPSIKFLKYIWNFTNKQRPQILTLLQKYKHNKRIFVIKNQVDLQKITQQLTH